MITTINEYKLINEKFVNLWNKEDMKLYIDEVFSLMVKAYESIGGFLTAKSADELCEKTDLIKIIKRNGKISAVSCYKVSSFGRKLICGATNATEQGKKDLFSIIKEDITQIKRNSYSEVSGKLEHIYLKYGSTIVQNYLVSDIIGKDIIIDKTDDFHYYREIKGQLHRKLLVGNINKS